MNLAMKKHHKLIAQFAIFCSLLFILSSCSRDNDIVIPQTSVNPFTLSTVNSGEEITFTGSNMHLITKVTFEYQGVVEGKESLIVVEAPVSLQLDKRDREALTVIVPALDKTRIVALKATYNTSKRISISDNLEVIVPPVIPTVASQLPAEVNSGEVLNVTGTNLNIIKAIKMGDLDIAIRSKNESSLSFVAPELETELTAAVKLIYDNSIADNQELIASQSLTIKPLAATSVHEWNVTIGGQATGLSFFDATTGRIVTPCDVFAHQEEIDFIMNVSTAGENQLYNPAGSTNVLKNQKCGDLPLGVAEAAGGDGKNYAGLLAVSTKFRLLSSSNAAQNALIQLVVAGTITDLSTEAFAGISAPSSNTPKNFNPGDVLWFFNEKKSKNGLIEIREVLAGAIPEESTIRMKIYYQK